MKDWEQNQSSGSLFISAKNIFNFISLKVCKVKEQQKQISARNLFCQKRNMGIIEKLKHKEFFWSAVSLSVGVLSLVVWDTILQSEMGSSKPNRDKADENRASPNICLCVSLSVFVIAVDDNSDVCWGTSSFIYIPGVKGPSFLYTASEEAEIQFQILSLWAIIWIVLNIMQYFHGLKNCSVITPGSSLEGKCYSVIHKMLSGIAVLRRKKEKNHRTVQQCFKEAKLFQSEQNVMVVPWSVTTQEHGSTR